MLRGNLWIRTSREGAFSALGHDLLFELKGFELEAGEGRVSARIDLRRLEPCGALRAGKLDRHALSGTELAQIRQSAHEVVLQTTRYPEARVQGTYETRASGVGVRVELELNGQRAPLEFDARREGESYRARFELVPSRWGIKPYRAFLGALRLRDSVEVEVEVKVPATGLTPPPSEME